MSDGRVPLRDALALTVITNPNAPGDSLEVALAALRAGARAIQLRWKAGSTREIVALGRELRGPTREAGAILIVNDRVDIALVVDADGVHLGDDDLPLADARRIAPPHFILGRSVDTPDEAAAAERAGADYVGFGPIHPTATKADTGPVVGENLLSTVRRRISIPVVAIGGLQAETAGAAIRAGADGIAVVSAVSGSADPEAATRRILDEVRTALRDRQAEIVRSRDFGESGPSRA